VSGAGRYECGVCWRVYDPAEGDPGAEIPPGTAFEELPEFWCCPNCDTPKQRFLALDSEPKPAAEEEESCLAALATAYRKAEAGMRSLEIFNPALAVELVGFTGFGTDQVGIVVTPWFMNLVLLPGGEGDKSAAPGEKVLRTLPAGTFEFVVGRLDGVGAVLSCSLLSPVLEFEDQAAVRLAAEAALAEVLRPAEPEPVSLGRRALLFGSGR
jgi:[NiFe] hydrogenase assembly HybE family chaperone